jgi:light-harvesting complex 1 beta chain
MERATQVWTPQMQQNDSRVFLGIFVVGFVVLLGVALVAQLLTWPWRSWLPGAESEKSLIGGVKVAVYSFMSHLT